MIEMEHIGEVLYEDGIEEEEEEGEEEEGIVPFRSQFILLLLRAYRYIFDI